MAKRIKTTTPRGVPRFDFSALEVLGPPVDPEESTDRAFAQAMADLDEMVADGRLKLPVDPEEASIRATRKLLEARRARKAAVTPDKT